MFDSLNAQLGKLLGKRDDDPQSTITADQLKVVLKSIEGKYNNLKNENKLFKSKIDEQKATIAELTQTVSELKGGAGVAESTLLTQLEADLDATRSQLTELRENYESARAEKLGLQSKLSVQEALVSSLRQELSELRDHAAGGVTPEEHGKLMAEQDRLKSENSQLQAKLQDLASKLIEAEEQGGEASDLKSALDQAEKELLKAREEAKSASKAQKKLESERTALMERLEALTDQIDELKEAQEDLEASAAVIAGLKSQVTKLQETVAALELDKEELGQKILKQQGTIGRLEEQLASGGPQNEVLAELEERYIQTKARAEHLASENRQLQERMHELLAEPGALGAREKTELELQVRRLSDELKEAGLQIASLREIKVKANLDLEEAAAELVELRRQLDELRKDRNFYRERLETVRESQDDVESIKSQMRSLMNEVSRLRGEPPAPSAPVAPAAPAASARLPLPRARNAERPAPPPPAPEPAAEPGQLARRREMLNKLIGDKKNP